MLFLPRARGEVDIRAAPDRFRAALERRVQDGLLTGAPHPRARYRVESRAADRLAVTAIGWWTAINVGLNEVELRLDRAGRVTYDIRYWRWAAYALGLSGLFGVIGLVLMLGLGGHGYIVESSPAMGGSPTRNLAIAWSMILFWGFAWPWIMIALHKRPVRRLLERIISEVDEAAG